MRNKTMTNGLKMIRRALALCLCLVLAAAAEDWLNYECTLPDGRILLTGGKMENGRDGNFVPWIVCMNQDRTVSWELIDRQEEGSTAAGRAAVLEDGTIAVNIGEHTEKEMIRFFTKDGEKARPDLELPSAAIIEAAEASYVMLTDAEDGGEQTILMDYEGKELLRYSGVSLPNGYGYKVKGGEDLVLTGGQPGCERQAAFFLPEFMAAEDFVPAEHLRSVKLQAHFGAPGHRDYLGAALGLGITRESLGDIRIFEDTAYVFCLPTVEPLLLEELKKVGRVSVTPSPCALEAVPAPLVRVKALSFTVKSLRLDAVAGAMFGLSRTAGRSGEGRGRDLPAGPGQGLPCRGGRPVQEGSTVRDGPGVSVIEFSLATP